MRPRLLDDWPAVAERVRAARSLAIFLDFDGTLAPTVNTPGEAEIERAARSALRALAANPKARVCIISGRRRADVVALVGIPGVIYLGVHGAETATARVSDSVASIVRDARDELTRRLNGTRGIAIEDKGIAFAVHYRNAGHRETSRARKLLENVATSREGALKILHGDCVWEVLPREIGGKGEAARRLWRSRSPMSLPVYIGNDATDEGAYRTLAEGVTAKVGAAGSTHAHYLLKDTREVARFLERLRVEMGLREEIARSVH